jgi:putative amide transporter protein
MTGSYLGVPLLFIGMVLLINAAWLNGRVETKDVGVFNLLVGLLGTASAMYFGWAQQSFALCAGAMLFAMTYLWVGINALRGAQDQRALGLYCLLVAFVTIPYAIKALKGGDIGWAFEWVSYGLLWYFFYLLLARGMSKMTGATAALTYFVGAEVLVTGWVYLYGYWPFGNWWPLQTASSG